MVQGISTQYFRQPSTEKTQGPFLTGIAFVPAPPAAPSAEPAQTAPQNRGARFRVVASATRPEIIQRIGRRERIVLLLLDGKRTASDIARLVHRDEQEIARTIVHLHSSGYAEHIG